jgi:hypothetical protein
MVSNCISAYYNILAESSLLQKRHNSTSSPTEADTPLSSTTTNSDHTQRIAPPTDVINPEARSARDLQLRKRGSKRLF